MQQFFIKKVKIAFSYKFTKYKLLYYSKNKGNPGVFVFKKNNKTRKMYKKNKNNISIFFIFNENFNFM